MKGVDDHFGSDLASGNELSRNLRPRQRFQRLPGPCGWLPVESRRQSPNLATLKRGFFVFNSARHDYYL